MNAISSLTLRGPVFARSHSWSRAVMHPAYNGIKTHIICHEIWLWWKPMRIIRLLILRIMRMHLSAFEWLHIGYRNDFNAIMGFIMRMHYNVIDHCSCFHMNTLYVFMALFMLISMMLIWIAWYRAWNNSWLKIMIAHWIQMPSTLFITRFQYPMNAILHVDMMMVAWWIHSWNRCMQSALKTFTCCWMDDSYSVLSWKYM